VLRGKHLTEEGEKVQVLGSRVEGVDALVALPTRRPRTSPSPALKAYMPPRNRAHLTFRNGAAAGRVRAPDHSRVALHLRRGHSSHLSFL